MVAQSGNGAMIAGVLLIVIVAIAVYYFTRRPEQELSTMEAKRIIKGKQTPEELEQELRDLKIRIGNAQSEEYRMYEGYVAPGNPGITVAGTIIETMIDVAVAVLSQENTRKIAIGFIKDEKDAEVVANGIRKFADDAIELIQKTNFFKCEGKNPQDPCLKAQVDQDAINGVIETLVSNSVEKTLVTPDMMDAGANITIQQMQRVGRSEIPKKEEIISMYEKGWRRFSSRDKGKEINEGKGKSMETTNVGETAEVAVDDA